MPHIAGAEVRGSHTTVTEKAEPIAKFLSELSQVSGIQLGKIDNKGGTGSSNTQRVKIIDDKNTIEISVSGNSSDQSLRVFLQSRSARQPVKLQLARFVRNQGYYLHFHDIRCGI